MWVAWNRARFLATRPRVFCEPKIMKIVILIYQVIQEKFAYGELFMLVMIGCIYSCLNWWKKMKNSGLEIVGAPVGIIIVIVCQAVLACKRHFVCFSMESWISGVPPSIH